MRFCSQEHQYQTPVGTIGCYVNSMNVSFSNLMHTMIDYEAEDSESKATTSYMSGTPEFEEFEAYFRRELPHAVEARLWSEMNSDRAPIAEALRALLADVLPSCQSMVAENFRKNRALKTSICNTPQSSLPPLITYPVGPGADAFPIYHEPTPPASVHQHTIHLRDSTNASTETHAQATPSTENHELNHDQFGYSEDRAPPMSCICPCHAKSDIGELWSEMSAERDCELCSTNHLDSQNLSFDEWMNLRDF